MIKVKATREGLEGHTTSSGYVIDRYVPFVALPSTRALGRFVRIRNPGNGRAAFAVVLDVGPWNGGTWVNPDNGERVNTNDDGYLFAGHRPQSETGTDLRGRKTNGSGIDLGGRIWEELGMTDNTDVEWEFLEDAPQTQTT